jgi:hypothetical protein
MAELSDIERFQRWLQSILAETENIENEKEKLRRQIQIESAIQETIRYKELISISEEIAPPFVERNSPVRVFDQNESVKKENTNSTCGSCEKQISPDLEFCPNCGDFL